MKALKAMILAVTVGAAFTLVVSCQDSSNKKSQDKEMSIDKANKVNGASDASDQVPAVNGVDVPTGAAEGKTDASDDGESAATPTTGSN